MKARTKNNIKSALVTTLLTLLTVTCGWFTCYLDTSVNNVWAKGFGTLVFGSLTFIFLIGAIFAPSVIRDAIATRQK